MGSSIPSINSGFNYASQLLGYMIFSAALNFKQQSNFSGEVVCLHNDSKKTVPFADMQRSKLSSHTSTEDKVTFYGGKKVISKVISKNALTYVGFDF